MSNFSRILHHIDIKDVKKRHLEQIAAQKLKEKKDREEKRLIQEISKIYKSDWKREIYEGMTSSNALTMTVAPAEGDGTVTAVDAIDATSYLGTINGLFGAVEDTFDGNTGTVVRDSGSGTGSDGGFNVGGKYLAFQGDGYNDTGHNMRWASLSPIDSSRIDSLTITAIVGNDSNGGEDPDATAEDLRVMYKTPSMDRFRLLFVNPNGPDGAVDSDLIIPIGASGNSGLNNYSVEIPEWAREKNTQFMFIQLLSSGSAYDHYGITNIKFKRKAPVNVAVPLDDPAAISFINVGTSEGDPKKRKKKIQDQLDASDEYTTNVLGDQFPGQGGRVDGEDPFKSAPLTPDDVIDSIKSPIGKDEVTKSFKNFQTDQEKSQVVKTPEQIKAQNDEYYDDLNNVIERGNYSYDDPEIVEIADKIIKLDPTSTDAYFYKSAYYNMTGEPKKGLKVIDQLIKNNPDNPDGYAVRSYYREEAGDLAGAIEDIEKTIELDPDSPYVSYYEMDLADLKYQEAEVEKDNAVRDRMESEAGAIEAKAHEDYWNNADLIEQEEPVEYEYVDDKQLVRHLNFMDMDTLDPMMIPSLNRQAADWASGVEVIDPNPLGVSDIGLSDLYAKAENWEGTPEEFAEYYANWAVTQWHKDPGDEFMRTYNYNSMIKKLNRGNSISIGKVSLNFQQYKLSDIKNMAPDEVIDRFRRASYEYNRVKERYETNYKNASSKTSIYVINTPPRLHNLGNYIKTLSENLPDYFFESRELAPVNTLYDQMKALYDEEDPEKEIKTELKAQGYEKQYKDLMTAWDSADKFSKFITPLKNLSDALLGSKTAQNAKYENYKIAIAKSIMLNKPIRVNPDTIDPMLIKKLGDRITPNQILDYDEEQRYKAVQEKYIKASKAAGNYNPSLVYDYEVERMMSGEPVIPIVSEAVPYADENIYEDEFGKVFINDGSVANNTFQADKGYHGFASAYVNDIMETNPIAGRGQAQYQIVVPPDGTEPYLLYKDHAYHNVKSTDKGEVPGFMNQGAAGFVNWLGNTAHNRGDGDANTGGMSGYPPNIRGDVITEFRINLTDLPEDVQGAVYRHPLMTEQPELTQFLKDTFYAEKWIKNIGGSKGLHDAYMTAIKAGDKLKDWITDNRLELLAGGKYKSASNLLQKYDDFIQQTVHTSDGRTYVPGYIDADGNVLQRVDVTDSFKKEDQNLLKNMFNNDEGIQKILKNYIDGNLKADGSRYNKQDVNFQLSTKLSNLMSKESPDYRDVFANSLGKSTSIDVDEFLKGKIVLKKGFEFREKTVNANWFVKSVAAIIDVSPDAAAASSNPLMSLATMTAARQLLHPVRGPATDWRKHLGHKQTFAQAMEVAPQMPYKLEFDVSEKIMKILKGIEDKDESDPRSGIAGLDEPIIFDKDKKNNVKESTLFERIKPKPFFNPKDIKPTFPENPPPKLDPKTGMHPRYGKNANRYKKLDPISANSMPPTGDPETDAIVDKQRTKPKSKLYDRLKNNIRKDLTNK